MQALADLLVSLHQTLGNVSFLILSLLLAAALCALAIPFTTDLMVNNAAGLSGRLLGPSARTFTINASTNNPEAATMIVSMSFAKMGGWANPLGSLLANIYLMYLIAPAFVALRFALGRNSAGISALGRLLWKERALVFWHVAMSTVTFAVGVAALWLVGYHLPMLDRLFGSLPNGAGLTPHTGPRLWAALAALVAGIAFFLLLERRLKRSRPTLFSDIDAEHHGESVLKFLLGTAGLIAACTVMNGLFLAWTALYGGSLSTLLGAAVYTGLQYVVGALITSLPELLVACRNYRRLTVPDLNTALGSASYSNITNLILALLGLLAFTALALGGRVLPWE